MVSLWTPMRSLGTLMAKGSRARPESEQVAPDAAEQAGRKSLPGTGQAGLWLAGKLAANRF